MSCLRLSVYCGFTLNLSYLSFSSSSSLHPCFGFLPPSLHPCCSSSCPRGPIVPLWLPLIDSRPLKGHLSRIWLDTHDIRQTNVFFKPSNSELHHRPGETLRGLMLQHLLECLTRSAKQLFVSPVCAEGLQSLLQWICYNVLENLWSSWVTDQGPVWNLVDGGAAFRLEPQWELRIGHRSSQQTSMRCWWFSSQKELEFWFFIRISRPYFQLDVGGELPQGGAQEDFTTSSTQLHTPQGGFRVSACLV